MWLIRSGKVEEPQDLVESFVCERVDGRHRDGCGGGELSAPNSLRAPTDSDTGSPVSFLGYVGIASSSLSVEL